MNSQNHTPRLKQPKIDAVSALTTKMKSASSVVFIDYKTLTMKEGQAMKKDLLVGEGKMMVAKNTLIKIAGKNAGLPEEALTDSVLSGQTAIIFANNDPVSPIQILGKFMAKAEKTTWKAGVVEGSFQDAASLSKISKLPSKEELFAQVVGGVSAPLYGLVATLNGNIQKLVYVLNARRESMNA